MDASRTHSVSEARRIERVAAAMFNAPDPDEPAAKNLTWPPTHPDDLAWWLTRAEAAINAIKEPS